MPCTGDTVEVVETAAELREQVKRAIREVERDKERLDAQEELEKVDRAELAAYVSWTTRLLCGLSKVVDFQALDSAVPGLYAWKQRHDRIDAKRELERLK